MAGKGSKYRPVDRKIFGDNYDRIFGKKEVQNVAVSSEENASLPRKEGIDQSVNSISQCQGNEKCGSNP